MAIRFLNTVLSGSLNISGSYTLPNINTSSTPGVLGQLGINGEVPHFYNSQGWQAVSGSKFTPIPPEDPDIEYVVVAGGGGAAKAGGGAGGYLSSSLSSIGSGTTITVTIGAGGTGIQGSGQGNTANQGGNSSLASSEFSTITAIGGGGGAVAYYGVGGDGGSGGGGAGLDATGDGDGGSGTAGQGFDGGDGKYTTSHGGLYAMGGGGGASEVGSDGQNSTVNGSTKNGGDGGDGKQSKITGTATYYAGGGGGGVHGDSTGYVTGDGGQGGGADAADQPGSNGQNAGNAGTANTGGGGGGAASLVSYSGQTGGAGGSGIVILRYPSSSIGAIGGTELKSNSGERIHKFTSSGTLVVGSSTSTPPTDSHYPSTVTKPNIFINPRAIGTDGTFDIIPDYGSVGRDFHNAGGSNNTKINTAAGSYDALDNAYGTGARGFVAGGTTLGVTYSDYNTNQDHSYNMFFRYDPSMESDLNYPLLWMVKPNTADNSTSYYGGIQIAVWRGGYSEVGKIYAGLYAVSNGSNVHGTTQTTTRTSGDTWYMCTVVVTYGSSGNIKIYLNGSLEVTSSTADNTGTGGSSNHVSIAESYWSAASVNPGGMTIGVSHAWFGTALTATDVTNLWNFYKADYGLS